MHLDKEELENMPQGTDVFSLSDQVPTEEELYDLAELFKVFGDSTRIKILYVLVERHECRRHCAGAQYDAEFDFPSAARAQAEPSGAIPPRGKEHRVFAGR